MADKFDFEEDRSVLSVLEDQYEEYNFKIQDFTEEFLTAWEEKLLNGQELVKGQIVYIKSTGNSVLLGKIPAIVTDIKRFNTTGIEYTFMLLAENLNGELVPVKFTNEQLADAVSTETGLTDVLDEIKLNKLGYGDLAAIKVNLGVKHLYILDTVSGLYKSYM